VDRNFRSFLILSIGMLFLFLGLQRMFLPEKPPAPQGGAAAQRKADQNAGPGTDAETIDATGTPTGTSGDAPDGQSPDKPAALKPANPERLVTLGSMNPAKGYQLLVTLTSRGGGIERVELVDERKEDRFRYRALEHQGGYLGYLGWRPVDRGLQINTLPDGSAAAAARSDVGGGGLQVGDVLLAVDDAEVPSTNALQRILRERRPGAKVKLSVERPAADGPQNLTFTAELSQPPLDILRTQENLYEQITGNLERLSCLTTLSAIGDTTIPVGARTMPSLRATLVENWEVLPLEVPGGDGVEFRLPLASYLENSNVPADLVLIKRYRLLPVAEDASYQAQADGYAIDFETLVVNQNDQPVDLALRHEGLAGMTLEGWWYSVKVSPFFFKGAGQRDVRFADGTGTHHIVMTRTIYDRKRKTPRDPGLFVDSGGSTAARSLSYVGLDAQYFAAAMLPHPDDPTGLQNLHQAGTEAVAAVNSIKPAQAQATNVTFWFDTEKKTVEPGGTLSTRYRIFAGPKDPGILAHYGMERFIEYGWFPLIAKPLSFVLYAFYSVVRNYGIAIIMLTLLVRGAMFPLGRQAAINAQKMQELQPELKRLNDLHKDDMQKRAEAMRELYQRHNFRPLSSCLPMFFQIPIFIGLYRCLSVDISLRQEPLFPGLPWANNLAGPDMLLDWSGWMPDFIAGRGTGYLGPYFNLLPVITVALFLVQQKILMPKATDEQTRMTQNMMQIMTIVMGVLFFKVPSGLCIYFITSSLWSLAERRLVKRLVPPRPAGAPSTSISASAVPVSPKTLAAKPVSDSKKEPSKLSGMLSELKEMLEKPAVRSGTQRREGNNSDGKSSEARGAAGSGTSGERRRRPPGKKPRRERP
jgi:YidC/Oxa1 family membrane protein insertase